MMASSIDLCTSTLQTSIRPKAKRRSHSWPEADLCFLRQCTSGIFEPLPYQEEIELRSAMTSRNSNYSTIQISSMIEEPHSGNHHVIANWLKMGLHSHSFLLKAGSKGGL